MKFYRTIAVVLLLILLTACQQPTNEEVYYKAQKKLAEMESYQCTAKIFVPRDSGEQEYVFQQTFQYPNKYRLEVKSPQNLEGNLTISNGKTAWIKHPAINQIWRMEEFEQSQEQLMFIGYFMRNFLNSEESTIEGQILEENNYIVITTPLPKGNYYFYQQKLWVDAGELVPTQLQIIDEKGQIRFRVLFEDFQYNPKLKEDLFNLD